MKSRSRPSEAASTDTMGERNTGPQSPPEYLTAAVAFIRDGHAVPDRWLTALADVLEHGYVLKARRLRARRQAA